MPREQAAETKDALSIRVELFAEQWQAILALLWRESFGAEAAHLRASIGRALCAPIEDREVVGLAPGPAVPIGIAALDVLYGVLEEEPLSRASPEEIVALFALLDALDDDLHRRGCDKPLKAHRLERDGEATRARHGLVRCTDCNEVWSPAAARLRGLRYPTICPSCGVPSQ